MLADPRRVDAAAEQAAALKHFVEAGKEMGIEVEMRRRATTIRVIVEYDGPFIRETTALDNHTYRFANKAEKEDMVVIDDPGSILKCTNKIYLQHLLKSRKLPTAKTWKILDRDDMPGRAARPARFSAACSRFRMARFRSASIEGCA